MLDGGLGVAQMGDYNMFPRMRSYLQRPGTDATEMLDGGLSVPSVTDDDMTSRGLGEQQNQRMLELPKYSEILIDKTVDPDIYIVGAGDFIGVYLWGELDQDYPMRVTAEGYLLLPTVGPIQISDMTLTEATAVISAAVARKYQDIEISVNLIDPRRFRLSISGVVDNPGMFEAHPLMRVSDLLLGMPYVPRLTERSQSEMALNQQQQQQQQQTPAYTQRFMIAERCWYYLRSQVLDNEDKKGSSTRNITIKRNGEVLDVDLLRYEKLSEIDRNPYVNGGDEIYVPPYTGDLYISGEVNTGGIYEFRQGDTVADLIAFGGGLTAIADTANAHISRFDDSGSGIETILVDLYDAIQHNPDDPAYLLSESDRLFVQTKFEYKVLANVMVTGQVRYPGNYAVVPHETTLTDVINNAGGFTAFSNLEAARIIRMGTSAFRDLEYERLQTMMASEMTDDEYEYFKHRSRTVEGSISIDFVSLFREGDETHDVYLEPGDDIFIPLRREYVNVLGAVMEPGYIRVEQGADYDYYINQAGGFNWNAKTRSVRVVKAKSGQRLRPGRAVIEGGDTVMVPEKEPVDYWMVFRDTAALFADMATLIIIARNVLNN
jgi:protein involved in polysaccharide export with SLBB domain